MNWHALRAYGRYLTRLESPRRAAPSAQALYWAALAPQAPLPETVPIEQLRRRLARSTTRLTLTDHGAGPADRGGGSRTVRLGDLARRAACPRRQGERLLRLTRWLQPQRMLELGTHLGFSALYQSQGAPQARLLTLEGDPALAELARAHLQQFGRSAEVLVGPFDQTLAPLDLATYRPEFVYLDGDHRYAPTLRYFAQIAPHVPPGGLIVLDDLYWSPGMTRAWQAICARPEVSLSLDLYHLGLCVLHGTMEKRHHVWWGGGKFGI